MGTIKLKKVNTEVGEVPVSATPINASVENVTAKKRQWDDPAILKEITDKTNETSRHYKLNNGTAKSIISAEPSNYFDETEENWKPIDNSLSETAQGYESICGKYKTEITKPDQAKSVKMTAPNFNISWTYLGKQTTVTPEKEMFAAQEPVSTSLNVEPSIQGTMQSKGSRGIYQNADRDTDIEYKLFGNNVKENIVVKEKAEDYKYLFALNTQGLKLRLSEDNSSLELYSESVNEIGETVTKTEATIPAPFMYDAKGKSCDDVYFELAPETDGKYTFAVIASADWINEENRSFPVTIDPQIVTGGSEYFSKTVQYRNIYTSSSSGNNYSNWYTSSSNYIRVLQSSSQQYRTTLTINKAAMAKLDYPISNVKLFLTPYRITQVGYCFINGKSTYLSGTSKKTVDITSKYKGATNSFTVVVEPYGTYSVNAEFYASGTNAPYIEVEYLINGKAKRIVHQFTLAGGAVGQYDVVTGDVSVSFEDVPASDSLLGIGISHVYKKSGEQFNLGNNFRLSLHETLSKTGAAALDADFVYTDSMGMKHGFKDTYYYIDISGEKVSVQKNNVEVDLNGKLTYTKEGDVYEVKKEQRTLSGLTATTQYEDFKGVEWLEQRLDEQKQLQQQVETYVNTLNEYVIVKKEDGSILHELKNFISNGFNEFIGYITGTTFLLPKNEALSLRSLKLQTSSLEDQITALTNQMSSLTYSETSLYYQYMTMDNTKDQKSEEGDTGNAVYKNTALQNLYNDNIRDNLEAQHNLIEKNRLDTANSMTHTNVQKTLCADQIDMFAEKAAIYVEQVKQYYKEYVNLKNQLDQLNRQAPVNYLTDGKIIKGFNEEGRLVAIFDKYENVMTIEYDESGKIVGVYDGEDKQITFDYRPDGLLGSITDTRGRRISYKYYLNDYTKKQYLAKIFFSNGKSINLDYHQNGDLYTVISSDKLQSYLYFNDSSELSSVETVSLVNGIAQDKEFSSTIINIESKNFLIVSPLTTIEDYKGNKAYYKISEDGNVSEYYEEENGKVISAELYDYVPYEKDNVQQANRASLYMKAYEDFCGNDFVGGDTVNTVLDEFNNPATVTTNARALSNGTTQQTTVTYEYNDDHKCIKETATVKITGLPEGTKTYTQITAYNYNAAGNVVRKESYIEGEEYTTGKSIEETVYDENGNVVKFFSYNSLDSSSKFYSESEYAENGQVLADYDETGENKTEYEYISGTNVVRSQKLSNGSKFAYGHDESDTVTSITQSTEEGEENSTHTRYTCGEVTELVSGNNKVNYEYDQKRGLSKVKLNGKEYVTITTEYGLGATIESEHIKYIARGNDEQSDYYEVTKNKRGDVVSVKYAYDSKTVATPAYAELYTNVYDAKNRVVQITQDTATLESNEYDDYDRQTKHTFGAHVHETEYNGYGQTSKDIITFGNDAEDKLEYTYAYDDEKASRPMTGMTAGAFGEGYKQDALGRSAKLTQTLGGNTYTKRYGYYKQGDHATSRVNTVYYGKNGVTDGKATYTYDGMGNIVSVNENGKQHYKYTYDKLGRLNLEKDLYKNREVCYTYDNNGNILTKSIDGEVTEYRYKEGTDQLVSFGTESIAYDNMGNPTTYKGMACTWEKGRQLASINDGTNKVEYEYDVFGIRTAKKIYAPKEETEPTQTTSYVYENGKLLRQITGDEVMTFVYGSEGVIGFNLRGSTEVTNGNYLYRKNLFGDITGIINESGALVYEYTYSAFGKSDEDEETGIGAKNPFRYRGYYYDEETGLYYLKSRYYDPEVGRFITIDDISYIDPETINGLNLYAYCGNNPVMNVDPNGKFFWLAFFAVVGISALIGAIDGGITAAMNGQNFWLGFAAGAIGGAIGGVIGYFLTPLGTWGNLLGRFVSSAIYNVTNELFQTGTLENMDWGLFAVDIVTDVVFSMLYIQGAQNIGAKISRLAGDKFVNVLKESVTSLVIGGLDAIVDIIQTATWFNKKIQEKIRNGTFSRSI